MYVHNVRQPDVRSTTSVQWVVLNLTFSVNYSNNSERLFLNFIHVFLNVDADDLPGHEVSYTFGIFTSDFFAATFLPP